MLLAVIVAAPFAIAALQAGADGWYPIGDNGTMLTVTRQVFTANTPLTGEVASGTRYGSHPFHPGPMVYYVLAPFVKVFGGPMGLLLGAAFVSVSAIVLIGYVALRTAGPAAAAWAWITTLLMCWSLGGTAFLYPPFKTTLALLVIALFLYLCAALVAGQSSLLPLWVLATSFPIAATMRYALPVAAIAGTTVLAVVVLRWRRVAAGPEAPDALAGRAKRLVTLTRPERRSVLISVVLFAVCWWGPIYEALAHRGGNVRELYRASRTAAGSVDGPGAAIAEQAKAILYNPVQSASDFTAPNAGAVVLTLLLLGAVTAVAVHRRRTMGRIEWAYLVIAAAALFFMVVSLATTPADEGFGIYRTLASSPVGAFVVFTAGLVIAPLLSTRLERATGLLAPVAIGALVIGAVAVAVPGPIDASTEQYPWAYETTSTLVDQAAPRLESDGQWHAWVIGGRTIGTVVIGFKASLEAEGVYTGIDARAPGLRVNLDDAARPSAGHILVADSIIPSPGDEWQVIATYEPENRDEAEAAEVAGQLADFARETNPEPLDALVGTMPRLLCPELASTGFQGECAAADELLASDNPVAELDPGVIALVYLVQFGEDTQFPVIDGEKPPEALLEAARRTWDDIPITVYALPAPDN